MISASDSEFLAIICAFSGLVTLDTATVVPLSGLAALDELADTDTGGISVGAS
jgi:hypothetical protein